MLQKQVREQMPERKVRGDGHDEFLDLFDEGRRIETIKVVDCIIINDAEARQLTDEPSIHRAAKKIMEFGPKAVVIKRGEYGATLFTKDGYFVAPAYPLESVFDPTGAGDTFAADLWAILPHRKRSTTTRFVGRWSMAR